MQIQINQPTDLADILSVHLSAFGEQGPEMMKLVDTLLVDRTAKPHRSLLATEQGKAVGHLLFTQAKLEEYPEAKIALLAPLAVIPEHQKQGIGGQLIKGGLERLVSEGVELVFVLGYPEYYTRHGFQSAFPHGFSAPYPIEQQYQEAWMVQELVPGTMEKYQGKLQCADTLMAPGYWRP